MHPLQWRALELCLSVALDRLPAAASAQRRMRRGHRCRTRSSPAFHSQNLKLPAPFVADTVHRILEESVLLPSLSSGEVEVDVAEAEWYQRLSKEAIAIATFGRNYDEGSAVFQMLAEHASYATERPSRFFSSTAAARVWRAGRPARPPRRRRLPASSRGRLPVRLSLLTSCVLRLRPCFSRLCLLSSPFV